MATIGFVAKQEDGSYKGRLTTLSVDCDIKLAKNTQKTKAEHPDFRILGRKDLRSTPVEIGAAWVRTNREGDEYVSVSISAPEIGRRIYANLGKAPGQDDPDVFALIWNDDAAAAQPVAAAGSDNGW
jgi:uncharacterized protein (DUF736 family)